MPRANQKLSAAQCDELVRLYVNPAVDGTWLGGTVLAARFGITDVAVYNILRKHDIPLRDLREAHAHGKRCKPIKNLPTEGSQPPACKCGCAQQVEWNQRKNQWNTYVEGHYRPGGLYRDRDWLVSQYIDANRTLQELAGECSVSIGTIRYSMRKIGVLIRSGSEAHLGRQMGADNPCWRGGTTPERQRLYKAGHWQEFCQSIYARDGFRCRRCNEPKTSPKGLHAHHVKAWAGHAALRFEESNVLSLCKRCHKWVHSNQNTEHEYQG
jgi:hypothetical protein